MRDKKLFLVCNAHLDPVWLWRWPEGAAETLSTFRTAARFCEEFQGFVFCHNEAVLYEWVEEFEPEPSGPDQGDGPARSLAHYGRMVSSARLQYSPVENHLSGRFYEARHIPEMFGVRPRTAVNFDPFGHTRGLVQILKKSGYPPICSVDPIPAHSICPGDDFIWTDMTDRPFCAHRAPDHYNSRKGKAAEKVEGMDE